MPYLIWLQMVVDAINTLEGSVPEGGSPYLPEDDYEPQKYRQEWYTTVTQAQADSGTRTITITGATDYKSGQLQVHLDRRFQIKDYDYEELVSPLTGRRTQIRFIHERFSQGLPRGTVVHVSWYEN